jgi:hypothetical protein
MASYELDKLVMLLSADWFLPHWHTIGIFAEEEKKRCLQQGCREIVRQIMSGAKQYWDTDFAPERVRKTRSAFDVLLKTCKVEEAAVNRISGLGSEAESPIDDGTRWLLVSMTEQLLDSSVTEGPPLDNAVKDALKNEWKQWKEPSEIDFKTLCLTSTTNWDQYLKSITPDLPAMLADYVVAIASQSKFEVLWGFINARLPAKQRHELLNWYRSVAQSLTGEPLRLAHET